MIEAPARVPQRPVAQAAHHMIAAARVASAASTAATPAGELEGDGVGEQEVAAPIWKGLVRQSNDTSAQVAPADREARDDGEAEMAETETGSEGVPGGRAIANGRLRRIVSTRFVGARDLNGWGQSEAAEMFGYTNSTQLSLIEQGKRLPPHDVILRAASVYGVSTDYLYGLTEEADRDAREATRRAILAQLHGFLASASAGVIDVLEQQAARAPGWEAAIALLSRADDVAAAFQRFQARNPEFEDLPAGAMLSRAVTELAQATTDLRQERDRHERTWAQAVGRVRTIAANDPAAPGCDSP